jgi:hypothetical protein
VFTQTDDNLQKKGPEILAGKNSQDEGASQRRKKKESKGRGKKNKYYS